MALIYRATGDVENIEPKNGTDFQLEELQEIVGGYIEFLNLSDDNVMVLNEEGKLLGLKFNTKANQLISIFDDFIVGDVLICKKDEIK